MVESRTEDTKLLYDREGEGMKNVERLDFLACHNACFAEITVSK